MNNSDSQTIQNSFFLSFLLKIRGYIPTISKILFLIISFYYLIHYIDYSITINIPIYFRTFKVIDKILENIESMGMLIIVIPMAIVLASFFEKNRFLQFLSMLCSYSGILFSLAHTTGRNLLEERMKTTLYTVFNTQNFVEKSELFRNAFNQRFNEANIIDKDFNSYIEKTSKINWDLY